MKTGKKVTILIAILIAMTVYTIFALLFLAGIDGTIILKSVQPNNIQYKSYDPYVLRIVEGRTLWAVVGWDKTKVVKITRSGDTDYSHSIELDILGVDYNKTKVVWTKTGIELIFDTGHKLTIPKKSFIGGR